MYKLSKGLSNLWVSFVTHVTLGEFILIVCISSTKRQFMNSERFYPLKQQIIALSISLSKIKVNHITNPTDNLLRLPKTEIVKSTEDSQTKRSVHFYFCASTNRCVDSGWVASLTILDQITVNPHSSTILMLVSAS